MNDSKNTAFGWILFSGIVALGLWILSSGYFHEERPEEMGYAIAGAEASGEGEAAAPDLGTLLASGSAEAGEKIFAKCTACHTAAQGGANGIGPNLFGVFGKPVGSHVAGFAYSPALSGHGGEWNWETMDAWLTSPKKFASGTKMSFAGLSKPEDRANVMLYLEANGGAPAKPAPAAPVAEETADADDADAATDDNVGE
jgi:cytochrome c